jgi:hypothetical protein
MCEAADCAFRRDPDEYLTRQLRVHRQAMETVSKYAPRAASGLRNVDPSSVPRRDFIDDYIFNQLAERGIESAPLAGDEEFLRRVTLDLTGRIPSPADIRSFVESSDEKKRDKLIDKLLASEEFLDKWTMWWGDVLKNSAFPSNFDRQQGGVRAYYTFIRESLRVDQSLKDFAIQLITASGNSFDAVSGNTNYPIASKTPMGPIQDTYDTMLSMTAATFLGLGEMDCLLCHNGRGRLEQVNLWASQRTRVEAWRMAAFFSRLNMPQRNIADSNHPYWRSFDTSDRTTGAYDLNTNWGNRPDRRPIGDQRNLTPEYMGTMAAPRDGNWRQAFAEFMVNDPMFARNFANRIWKEMFNLALVEPMESLDPARLDPKNPPPAPWTLQATHPELLEQLAGFLKAYDYNLRGVLRTIAQSSAYQRSSRYEGEWKYDYITSFARHYPRRLMAEEVHDAIAKSTGVPGAYTVRFFDQPLQWAMQLPEPAEPRSNGAVATFLNLFLRGNRDSQPRSGSLSILQMMNLMNDQFVLNRVRLTASPTLQAVARLTDNTVAIDELNLLVLGRFPTEAERASATQYLGRARDANERNQFLEDLMWALMNKPEFLFSY